MAGGRGDTTKTRELGAYLIWIPVALAYTMLYLLFISKILEIRMGMEGGAYVVVLPLGMLFFATVIWLPFFIWRRRSVGARLGLMAGVWAAALCALALYPACQFNCFRGGGSEHYIGQASMIAAFVGGVTHDAISRAFLAVQMVRA